MKKLLLSIGLLLTLTIHSLSAKEASNDTDFSEAQLAQMLAPIALYPDSLLTHILIAATYPIEVIEADRWIDKNSDLSAEKTSEKLEYQDWEPSVKALVMFPKILKRLSDDLSWTQQLGDAFLQDEENVLGAIQQLRYQAEKAGTLNEMENVKVTREKKNIIIQPVQKEVIYVPYYDSRNVYGDWHWSMNPPIYWDWGYSVSLLNRNPFRWHSGVHISLNYFFSAFQWSNRHVVVVDHRNTSRYRNKKHIVSGGYANRWVHNPHHRRGVSYRNENINKRFKSQRPVVHKTVGQHYNSPRQSLQNKSYNRNHKSVPTRHVTNSVSPRSGLSSKSQGGTLNKASKHEVLQRKFKDRTLNKNVNKRNDVQVRKSNNVVKNVNTPRYKGSNDRTGVTQQKSFSNKTVVSNIPSVQKQQYNNKPKFNESRKADRTPTYRQPKQSSQQYSKPARSQNVRSAPVRQSRSGTQHSGKRREHNK